MPRRPREYLPGYSYHVYQRGNNRYPCFFEDKNYYFYLKLWREAAARYGVAVHAYCLMTNHIHFLVTPSCKTGLSSAMRLVGSRYAYYINRSYENTGSLWEGRHRSSLVHNENYFLTCMRYIELNPVRARMVQHPEDYPWSSYRINAHWRTSWLTAHSIYLSLGSDTLERCEKYRALFDQQLETDELKFIRKATYLGHTLGSETFRKQIEQKYSLKPVYTRRGRPPKAAKV